MHNMYTMIVAILQLVPSPIIMIERLLLNKYFTFGTEHKG